MAEPIAICSGPVKQEHFSVENHLLAVIDAFLTDPDEVLNRACLQKFAKITPQYPGLRAPLDAATAAAWPAALSPLLSTLFGEPHGRWAMQAWYSIVALPPDRLAPVQRLPHVDGTDPRQVAMMLYLNRTRHGGTAFYRHRSTGLEALTAENWPTYKAALESEIARSGVPPAAYPSDGAPYFDRTYVTSGAFNQAVFYRGNLLHSGVIDNAAPLLPDPREGRLTINAFFRPPGS